jgi:PKD repeat protein
MHKKWKISRINITLRSLGFLLMASVTLTPLSNVQAYGFMAETWQSAYPDSLAIDNLASSCSLCHAQDNTSHFNGYGRDLAENGSDYQAVENLNSDNDPNGSTNLEEINANTQPGWTSGANNVIYDTNGSVSNNELPPDGTDGDLDPAPMNQPPTADSGGPYNGTEGMEVSFDGSASLDTDGNIVDYAWDFGDGSNGSGATISHTYQSSGTYTLTLTVTDDIGESDSDTTSVTIGAGNQAPSADPNGPYTGSAGVEMTFDATSSTDPDGSIISYDWDFGDGSSGTGVTTNHTYDTQGTYNLMLTVTDDAGASDSASTTVAIDPVNQAPVANAGAPYSANAGEELVFDGSGSTDSDGSIVSYAWDFGDGSTASGATPSHTYNMSGSYNVSLTVTDDGGLTHTDNTSATIGEVINQPPVADAGGPYAGQLDEIISFDGTASTDPDGSITSYEWDFGDGVTASGANPDHSYSQEGSYNVTLTVTDNDGVNDSSSTTAIIASGNLAPVADAGGPYSGSVDADVQFDGSGSSDPDGSIISYLWDFGDGAQSTLVNPSHSYFETGTYNLTLTVYDDSGASDAISTTVEITADATTADVYLEGLWVDESIRARVDRRTRRSVIALGQGTEVPQGATVRLSVTAPDEVVVKLRKASINRNINPDMWAKLYWFTAAITCKASGSYELSFSATISADENSDIGNDTLTTVTQVNCRDYSLFDF